MQMTALTHMHIAKTKVHMYCSSIFIYLVGLRRKVIPILSHRAVNTFKHIRGFFTKAHMLTHDWLGSSVYPVLHLGRAIAGFTQISDKSPLFYQPVRDKSRIRFGP